MKAAVLLGALALSSAPVSASVHVGDLLGLDFAGHGTVDASDFGSIPVGRPVAITGHLRFATPLAIFDDTAGPYYFGGDPDDWTVDYGIATVWSLMNFPLASLTLSRFDVTDFSFGGVNQRRPAGRGHQDDLQLRRVRPRRRHPDRIGLGPLDDRQLHHRGHRHRQYPRTCDLAAAGWRFRRRGRRAAAASRCGRKPPDDKRRRVPHIAAMPLRSPCTNVCRIERRSGFCEGCRRTVDEITRWPLASEGEQLAILAALPGRSLKQRRFLGVRW